jgi:hypothetical protein
MHSIPARTLRELDHRNADGIDVRLLWNPQRDQVSITVEGERLGRSLGFDGDGAEALVAFHRPYAFARDPRPASPPAQTCQPQGRRR